MGLNLARRSTLRAAAPFVVHLFKKYGYYGRSIFLPFLNLTPLCIYLNCSLHLFLYPSITQLELINAELETMLNVQAEENKASMDQSQFSELRRAKDIVHEFEYAPSPRVQGSTSGIVMNCLVIQTRVWADLLGCILEH